MSRAEADSKVPTWAQCQHCEEGICCYECPGFRVDPENHPPAAHDCLKCSGTGVVPSMRDALAVVEAAKCLVNTEDTRECRDCHASILTTEGVQAGDDLCDAVEAYDLGESDD